jgi:parvulin-like peptidyl-prolyl isomerase
MAHFPLVRSLRDSFAPFVALPTVLLAGAVLLSGCHPSVTDPNDPKFIVAEKGNWQITEGELETEVGTFLKQQHATPEQVGPSKMPMVKTWALKNMVLKKLILDKAATLQLKDVDKDEAAQLDAVKQSVPPGQDFDAALKTAGMTLDQLKQQIHEQVIIHKVLEADAFKNVDPTDQEIDAIYLAHKDSFNIPEKVRASRILILVDDTTSAADKAAKKKAIDAARARVMKGEDFSKVAMDVSQDRYSAPKGGDINFFQRGENEPGFDDVAFNTKQGVVSPVFLTSLGYQFLKVTAIQPAGVLPVADARSYISSKLRERNMQTQSAEYAKKLLADSGVTYHFLLVDPPAQMAPSQAPQGADNGTPSPGTDSSQQAPPSDSQAAPGASQQSAPADTQPSSAPATTPASQ